VVVSTILSRLQKKTKNISYSKVESGRGVEANKNEQLNLFEDRTKQKNIGYVMDWIRDKFGPNAILRAFSYMNGGVTRGRSKVIGEHEA
jgi:hypothetical protein